MITAQQARDGSRRSKGYIDTLKELQDLIEQGVREGKASVYWDKDPPMPKGTYLLSKRLLEENGFVVTVERLGWDCVQAFTISWGLYDYRRTS